MTYIFKKCIEEVLISYGAAEVGVLSCIWKTPFRSRRVPTYMQYNFPNRFINTLWENRLAFFFLEVETDVH